MGCEVEGWTVWVQGVGSFGQVCLETRGSIDWVRFLRGSSFFGFGGDSFHMGVWGEIAEDLGSENGVARFESIERQASETSSEDRKRMRRSNLRCIEIVELVYIVTFAVSMGIISEKTRSGRAFVLPKTRHWLG